MKWTDREITPAERQPRGAVQTLAAELAAHPGRWAEVARYEPERRASAYSRGSTTAKRYPSLDYAVERQGEEFILYLRHRPDA